MTPAEAPERFVTTADGIEICYQVLGEDDGDPLLLVMGLGGPMTWWDDRFCTELTDRGFRVVRYDNRDTGRSTKLEDRPVPRGALIRAYVGLPVAPPPYTLSDLGRDALAVLDDLGLDAVHVAGISMGGMIAQTLTLEHPARVRSLVSIMSTTGARRVGRQHAKLIPALARPHRAGRAAYLERTPQFAARIGSPAYPEPWESALARAEVTYDRGWSVSGVTRHSLAVLTQRDRTRDLARVTVPTAVVHGLADPMVSVSGGRATSRALRGSELVLVPGMGHDIPVELHGLVADVIRRTADRAASAGD